MNVMQESILNKTFRDFTYLAGSNKRMDTCYSGRANYINAYDLLRFLCEPYCNRNLCSNVDYQNYVNYKTQVGEKPYDLKKFKTNARDRLVKTVSDAVNTLTDYYSGVKVSKGTLAKAKSVLGKHTCFAADKNGSIALVVPFNKKSLTGFLKDMNNKKEAKIADTAERLQKLTKQKAILSAEVTKHVLANCLLEDNILGATPKERIDVIVGWLLKNFKKGISSSIATKDGHKKVVICQGAQGLKERAKEDSKLIANHQTKRQRNNHKARN